MNRVILSSVRCGRDFEARYNAEGTLSSCRGTMVADRPYRKDRPEGEQTADFISCVAFGRTGEFLEKYGKKGQAFDIEGRIQTGSYTNKDGQKVYTTDVVIERVEFSKGSPRGNEENTQPAPVQNAGTDDFMNIPDGIEEELPFN